MGIIVAILIILLTFILFAAVFLLNASVAFIQSVLSFLGLRKKRAFDTQEKRYQSYRTETHRKAYNSKTSSQKKVFSKDEGEYIDFKEYKDE